jgi:hypothetical protein
VSNANDNEAHVSAQEKKKSQGKKESQCTASIDNHAKKKVCPNGLLDKPFTQELKPKKKPPHPIKTTAGDIKKLSECLAQSEARATLPLQNMQISVRIIHR